MSQPVFTHKLEEDWVQRVGTKLTLEVIVEESSEKVVYTFFDDTLILLKIIQGLL